MSEQQGYELGWEDEIEKDNDFVLLPEGDYDFEVTEFERGRHNGTPGGKLPPCNKAVVHLKFTSPEGTTTIKHQLFLHSKTEGLLCAFFAAIGQRKKGEKLRMDWNKVPGSRGRCKLGVRKYKKDDGNDAQINEVKKFYPSEETAAEQPAATQGYTPGRF